MTDRPEGTPDPAPDDPHDGIEIEADGGERAPDAEVGGDGPAADGDDADADAEDAEDAELESDDDVEDEAPESSGPEPGSDGGPRAAAGTTGPRRRASTPPSVQRAPTQSELAVRVTDNVSRYFVIATVVFFIGILLFGMLGGSGGLLTATPAPVTPAPSASVAPSASAEASPSASAEASP